VNSYLYLDFETRSKDDIRKCGAHRYAEGPTTEILCVAYAINAGPLQLSIPGNEGEVPFERHVHNSKYKLVAHNAEFERCILRSKLGIETDVNRWVDTMALAAARGLPQELGQLGQFLGLDTQAKAVGKLAIDALCKPRRDGSFFKYADRPATFDQLYARCAQDVELLRGVHAALSGLSPREQEIYAMTMRMNGRGFRVDLPGVRMASALVEDYEEPLTKRFMELTGCLPKSYVKVAKVLGIPSVDRATVRKQLKRTDLSPRDREALALLDTLKVSSTAKLEAMQDRVCADGRIHGGFRYCGASRTGRWTGSGVQPQNLPRSFNEEDMATAFRALDRGALEMLFDGTPQPAPEPPLTVLSALSKMVRGMIVGPLTVGDLAQIEARILCWLAGQNDLLDVFRNKGDPYCLMASKIYGREITKKDKIERTVGKEAVLGAGYGLGANKLLKQLTEKYGLDVPESLAKKVITVYRQSNRYVVNFWLRLEKSFAYAIRSRAEVAVTEKLKVGHTLLYRNPCLWVELPSKRKLYYLQPRLTDGRISYQGQEQGRWGWISTYGGKIAENIVQAVARDVLAHAMLITDRAGLPIVMTVHDEIVVEGNCKDQLHSAMTAVPTWAQGLPIEAEVFEAYRYRK